jgi:hypothetical protein
MTNPQQPNEPAPPPVRLDYVAALLSYLVPGLGQLTQGRYGKGILFLVCLYLLFFYGFFLGHRKNVYIPRNNPNEAGVVGQLAGDIYTRFQFVGQAPIGMVAWPAIYQYFVYDDNAKQLPMNGFMRAPDVKEINDLQRNGDKTWDLGWVYTVIAGVLNVLVIYDALAGPAFRKGMTPATTTPSEPVSGSGS